MAHVRFRRPYGWPYGQELDASEMVEDYVHMDSYDRGGELEILKARTDALEKIVGFLATKLSVMDQKDLANVLGYKEA